MEITTAIPEKAISKMMIAVSTAISVAQIGLLLSIMIVTAEGEKVIKSQYFKLLITLLNCLHPFNFQVNVTKVMTVGQT